MSGENLKWRRVGQIGIYSGLIEMYLPYVFLQAVRYTNARSLAETFAAYVLLTSIAITQKIKWQIPFRSIIHVMAEIVGQDYKDQGNPPEKIPPFLPEPKLLALAREINKLDDLSGLIFVLHHIEQVDKSSLAPMFDKTATQIENILNKSQATVSQSLAIDADQLKGRLKQLTEALKSAGQGSVPAIVLYFLRDSFANPTQDFTRYWNRACLN